MNFPTVRAKIFAPVRIEQRENRFNVRKKFCGDIPRRWGGREKEGERERERQGEEKGRRKEVKREGGKERGGMKGLQTKQPGRGTAVLT